MAYKITDLYTYPIKSLPGTRLEKATLTDKGIALDRQWMLTHADGRFITQREIPALVLFDLKIKEDHLLASHPEIGEEMRIPFQRPAAKGEAVATSVWGTDVQAEAMPGEVNEWFSEAIGQSVKLVFIPEEERRIVKNHPDASVNFADSNQYLVLGRSSLDYLNVQLEKSLPLNRFRPNIVFNGGEPHVEDTWHSITIGDSSFEFTKQCGRCKITTINQETGEVGKEPLRTLARYRTVDQQVLFGAYVKLVESQSWELKVGDGIIPARADR